MICSVMFVDGPKPFFISHQNIGALCEIFNEQQK